MPTLTGCGQSERDFYADPQTAGTSMGSTANTNVTTAGGMSSSGGATEGASIASTVGAGGASSTASGSSGSFGSSGTVNNAATSTTGNVNDPECPEVMPEATSACLIMAGLTCHYGEARCVCSGLTWNCAGGSGGSTGTTAGTSGLLTTTASTGSTGSTG